MLDFKLAVIGPTMTRVLGIARGCADCAASRPRTYRTCQGFGPGCIAAGREPDHEEYKGPYIPA